MTPLPLRPVVLLCLGFSIMALSACGTASPAVRAWDEVAQLDAEECENRTRTHV